MTESAGSSQQASHWKGVHILLYIKPYKVFWSQSLIMSTHTQTISANTWTTSCMHYSDVEGITYCTNHHDDQAFQWNWNNWSKYTTRSNHFEVLMIRLLQIIGIQLGVRWTLTTSMIQDCQECSEVECVSNSNSWSKVKLDR